MVSAASRSLILESKRPQEPMTGFRTTGKPIWSIISRAASGVNATQTLGWGMPAWFKAIEVASLSPHVAATFDILTVGMPQLFRIWVAYNPFLKERLRSNTTSYFIQVSGFVRLK